MSESNQVPFGVLEQVDDGDFPRPEHSAMRPSTQSIAGYTMPKTTWKDRLRWRLFPKALCELPEAPATYKDVMHIHTTVVLGTIDRLRVLVSGCLRIETRTVTENMIGGHVTASVAYVKAPRVLGGPEE